MQWKKNFKIRFFPIFKTLWAMVQDTDGNSSPNHISTNNVSPKLHFTQLKVRPN